LFGERREGVLPDGWTTQRTNGGHVERGLYGPVTLRAPVASILGFKLTLGYADGVEDLQGEGKRFINMHFDNPARFVLEGNRNFRR
jgi:hypothetical protein